MATSHLLRKMEDAVLKAGRALSRDFNEVEQLQVSQKGPRDFVTSADLRADKILREELGEAFPKYGFLTEESGEIPGADSKHRFIIDPLDGTSNFMHGLPFFCISVALEQTQADGSKDIIAGIVHAPILNELFVAEKGQGAFMGRQRLQVSARKDISHAMMGAYPTKASGEMVNGTVNTLKALGCNSRTLGASALELSYVAAGKLDGFWCNNLKPWDIAAAILIIREARGMVADMDGSANMMQSGNIVATNQHLHDIITRTLAKHY